MSHVSMLYGWGINRSSRSLSVLTRRGLCSQHQVVYKYYNPWTFLSVQPFLNLESVQLQNHPFENLPVPLDNLEVKPFLGKNSRAQYLKCMPSSDSPITTKWPSCGSRISMHNKFLSSGIQKSFKWLQQDYYLLFPLPALILIVNEYKKLLKTF